MTTRWDWNPQRVAFVDFETQSAVNLRQVGSRSYLSHPTTRLLSAVFAVDGEVVVWVPPGRAPEGWEGADLWPPSYPSRKLSLWGGDSLPPAVKRALRTHVFVAHNAAGFDVEAWVRLIGGPQPVWFDTVPCARAAGLPAGLDALGKRFFGTGKDEAGAAALKLLYTAKVKGNTVVYNRGTVALWALMLRYNIIDVLLLERVFSHVNDYGECDVLAAHGAIDNRGMLVDGKLLLQLKELWTQLQSQATERVSELTEDELGRANIRSVPQVKAWLRSLGLHVDSLNRKELERLYDDPASYFGDAAEGVDLSRVVEVLRSRQTATRISTGKIDRILAMAAVEPDARVRGVLVYWGAHTGRWSGKGFQPHNLAKGVSDLDVQACMQAHAEGNLTLEKLKELSASCKGNPSLDDVLSTLLRPALCAAPGMTLGIVDYASIEARGIAWIAEQEDLLTLFREGADVYCDMASKLFGRKITKENKDERQLGKIIVLGCIAAGTPILTDRGWVAIEDVRTEDKVWDGEEWVTHGGVIYKGEKEVTEVDGVRMTPDHKVFTDEGWVEAWRLRGSTRGRLSGSVTADGRFLLSKPGRSGGASPYAAGVTAGPNATLLQPTLSGGCRKGVTVAPIASLRQHKQSMPLSAPTPGTGSGCLTESVQSSPVARTRTTADGTTTAGGVSPSTRRGLRTGESSWRTYSPWRDGKTPPLKLIASTTTGGMNRGTYALQPGQPNAATAGPVAVYDILDAGPRNRFQAGPLVVHNCGYGMGANNFAVFCKTNRINLDAVGVTAEQCIEAYRDAWPQIAGKRVEGGWRRGGVWKELEAAAKAAIESKGRKTPRAGKCVFHFIDGRLEIELPSGRRLVYRDACVEMRIPGYAKVLGLDAKPRPAICYTHPHGYEGNLYGGLIAENVVQAICRDILATALVRCEEELLPTVLHVHDEIVCEFASSYAEPLLKRQAEVMCENPEWASGFPIGVEGFTCDRYVKSPFPGAWLAEGTGGRVHLKRKK